MRNYLTVSPSSLSTFFKCSQHYKWLYLDELEPDEATGSIHAAFGTAIHKSLELHFKYGVSFEDVVKSWKVIFLYTLTEEKALETLDKCDLDSFLVRGYQSLDNVTHMMKRWADYKILDVEKYFKIPYKNEFIENVFITGRIDLLLSKIKSVVCLDWKSSKNKEQNIDENIQLTFYIYFANYVYKTLLENIHGALAYPYDQEIIFTQRSEKNFTALFDKINVMLKRIKECDFKKEPKINFLVDDCYFCPYTKLCCTQTH